MEYVKTRPAHAILIVLLLPIVLAGCRPGTPERAYKRFAKAVQKKDGVALFEAADQGTRWSWMSIHKYHREAYDIILSNYPADSEHRQRDLRRFEAGALASSARELFAAEMAPRVLPMLSQFVVPEVPIKRTSDTTAEAVLPSNARILLKKGTDGSWGYGGLAEESREREIRAQKDLDQVRLSGADYERAAARAAK